MSIIGYLRPPPATPGPHPVPVQHVVVHTDANAGATKTAAPANKKPAAPPVKTKANAGNAYGLPVMQSPQELRAEASSQAWKSIQSMMGQLPSVADTNAPYDAQRAALGPLVAAQRDWLQNVGTYHVGMINGLSQMIHDQAAPVQAAQASAEQAGGGLGASFGTNAPVLDASNPAAALGGSTQDYLTSLAAGLPAAMGVASSNRINAAADAALLNRTESVNKIQNEEPQLETSLYTGLSNAAFNNWKGELAAIQDGIKNKLATTKQNQTASYDQGRLKIAGENATTAQLRASNSQAVAQTKALAGADKLDKTRLVNALTAGWKTYNRVGGTKVSGSSGSGGVQTIIYAYPAPTAFQKLNGQSPKPIVAKTITGKDTADLQRQIAAFKSQYKAPTGTHISHWQDSHISSLPGGTKTAGGVINKPSTYTKRMEAWRILVAANHLNSKPLSTADLQTLFRDQYGSPTAA